MKKRMFYLLTAGLIAVSALTGCGSGSVYKYNAFDGGAYTSNSYEESAYVSRDVDYSKYDTFVTADGRLVDYSYNFSASGDVKEKKTGTNLYEEIEEYVKDNGGYVENVNNSFSYYDKSEKHYYNSTEIDYEAYGWINFTIQIPNDNADGVIETLENYCNNNGFVITNFNQRITNFESYNIVDEYGDIDSYNYYPEITQSDLDKQLQYTDITVSISYGIKRDFMTKFGMNVASVFDDIFDQFEDVIYAVISILVVSFTILFVAIIGIGMITKSRYKRYKKHPEWYIPKEVVLRNADTTKDSDANLIKVKDNKKEDNKEEKK